MRGFESYETIIHSDTLFGGIVNSIDYLGIDVLEFIEKVSSGEIQISSAFPFEGEILSFPPPITSLKKGDLELKKKFKKRFLTSDGFISFLETGNLTDDSFVQEDFALKKDDTAFVTLDRTTAASDFRVLTTIHFREDAGLFFLIRASDGDFRKFIDPAIKLLGDEGIGGERTYGFGQFDRYEVEVIKLPKLEERNVTLSLSIVNPDSMITYDVIRRGGWVFSRKSNAEYLKPEILMLKEGSVIKNDTGIVIDLDELTGNTSKIVGHKVYINASTFPVGMVGE